LTDTETGIGGIPIPMTRLERRLDERRKKRKDARNVVTSTEKFIESCSREGNEYGLVVFNTGDI
jgi:hypothetical protein